MIGRTNVDLRRRALVVDTDLERPATAGGRATREITDELRQRDVDVVEATSYSDGEAVAGSDAAIHCVFVNWTSAGVAPDDASALSVMQAVRKTNDRVPVFLMAERRDQHRITLEAMQLADEFVWKLADTSDFIAGRALAAIDRYLNTAMPPFMAAILNYNRDHEYSWAAPGHQGGIAFTKSTIGRVYFDFFGENLFRTDTGIERAALGSLLDHTGPIATSEANSARVFGADRTYSVLNGTSGSNRVIMNACIGDNQIAVCDRNCHKSIEQGLAQSGGIPVFFLPTRNRYGIIGPIHPDQMTPEAIQRKIADNPLARQAVSQQPVYTVVTNCTYDGMCYNAQSVEQLLERTFDRIHFDEAWYAYARFNPMYRDRFAMRGDPKDHPANAPTVFATQSTHKLLAALSQASFIHVRDGRNPIEHGRFNES